MEHIILLIERKRADIPSFEYGLIRKGFEVITVLNGTSAIEILVDPSRKPPHLIVINAASMRTTGTRICHSIYDKYHKIPLILITEDTPVEPEKIKADSILTLPFTLQKLHNRIKLLLPGDQQNVIQFGDFQLDLDNRVLRNESRQEPLTPRLANLLKVLIDNQGAVIEREKLFTLVWETAYTDDMRTLDVHISWLRQAIEVDPKKPKFIKTVRGVGYKMDF